MNSIISVFLAYNQFLFFQIQHLLVFIAKNIPLKPPKYDFISPKYNKFTVDKLPIIKKVEPLNYMLLLKEYQTKDGKSLKPAKSRGKNPVSSDCICPYCGHALSKIKDRKHFNIHKYVNPKCSFYLNCFRKLSSLPKAFY